MKKTILSLTVLGLLCFSAQSASAQWDMVYLNPLQYVGIGPNYSTFSLNPLTGFRNCNPCPLPDRCNKCKKTKCNECTTGAAAPIVAPCNPCAKAMPVVIPCNECARPIAAPCTNCTKRF